MSSSKELTGDEVCIRVRQLSNTPPDIFLPLPNHTSEWDEWFIGAFIALHKEDWYIRIWNEQYARHWYVWERTVMRLQARMNQDASDDDNENDENNINELKSE
jgi:hypothetical protein